MFRFGSKSGSSSKDRKKSGASSSSVSRRRAESVASASSHRKSRRDGKSSSPPARANSSGPPSSYFTAPDHHSGSRYEKSSLDRPQSLTESAIRTLTSYEDDDWEDLDARSERRSKTSSPEDKRKHGKHGSRNNSRERASRHDSRERVSRGEKQDKSDKTSERSRSKRRVGNVLSTERHHDSFNETSRGLESFNTRADAPPFSQPSGQYEQPYMIPQHSDYPPTISSHAQNSFSTQSPYEYTQSAQNLSQPSQGLAADYYGNQDQPVSNQPDYISESIPAMQGALPYYNPAPASSIPDPLMGIGQGAAAEYYNGSFQPTPSVKPTKPSTSSGKPSKPSSAATSSNLSGKPSKSSKPSKPSKSSSSATTAASAAAIGAATPGYAATTSRPDSQSYPSQAENASYYDHVQHATPSSVNPDQLPYYPTPAQMSHHHSTSEPVVPSTSAYYAPSQSSRPPKSGKQSSQSSSSHYAAGAAGLAAGAYAMHEYNEQSHQHSHQHTQQGHGHSASVGMTPSYYGRPSTAPYMTGNMAMQHKHKGPISRLVDWWKDYEDVRKMEEYTEYIGVCKYCFDPRTSAADAPRKHHYGRRRSSDSLRRRSSDSLRRTNTQGSKHTRVDKDSRYHSSDNERRKKSKSSWIGAGAAGAAGYGLARMWEGNRDFDDTYSVKSGRRSHNSRAHTGYRGDSIERGVIRDSKHRSHEGAFVRTKNGTVLREQDRSRSQSRDRKETILGAEATAGLGAYAAHHGRERSRDRSSNGAFVRRHAESRGYSSREGSAQRKHHSRSRSHSPSLGEILGFTNSSARRSRRASPRSTATSRTSDRESGGVFGGFFSKPEKKRREHRKKKKGFFTFSNSSSSSGNSDLAFGSIISRRHETPKKVHKTKSDERLNATLLGIGATAAAIAAAKHGSKQSRRKAEVVAVREKKSSKSGKSRKSARAASTDEEDEWESDDNSDSAQSDLAFGEFDHKVKQPVRRSSLDSVGSQSSATNRWSWLRGSKKRKSPSPRQYHPQPKHVSDGLDGMNGIPSTTPSARRTPSQGESVTTGASSHASMPPMKYVHPVSTSDPNAFDVAGGSIPGSFPSEPPVTTTRSSSGQIQQPQPIAPIQPGVLGTYSSYQSTYTALPEPSNFAADKHPGIRRTQSSPITSHFARDVAVAGGAAAITASILSNGRNKTPRDEGSAGVRFDLTEKQAIKAERERQREQEKEEDDRRRSDEENAAKEEAARYAAQIQKRDQEEAERRRMAEEFRRAEENAREERERADAAAWMQAQLDAQAKHQDYERRRNEMAAAEAALLEDEQKRADEFYRIERERYEREREEEKRRQQQEEWERQRREQQYREPEAGSSRDAWRDPVGAGIAGVVVGAALASDRGRDGQRSRPESPYEAREYVPSNERDGPSLRDEKIYDPEYFQRKRSPSDLMRETDLARKAAAMVVSDMEDRYKQPPPSQADFFAPKELFEPAKGKTAVADPIGDNNVRVYHVPEIELDNPPNEPPPPYQPSPKFGPLGDNKAKGIPWGIPQLNVIAPTPPVSVHGSVKGDKSPEMSHASPTVEDENIKDEAEEGADRRKANRVSWGQDQTRVYEVHTPDSSRDSREYITNQDLKNNIPYSQEEITARDPPPNGESSKTAYNTGSPPRRDRGWISHEQHLVEEIPREEARVPGDEGSYQRPFYEQIANLGLGFDSPGTEGAPPVRGFVEGEIEGPTPMTEDMPHIPGGFDDENDKPQAVDDYFSTPLSEKETKKADKAAMRTSTASLDEPNPTESEQEVVRDEVKDDFEAPLSRKEQKKRAKAAKRMSLESPSSPLAEATSYHDAPVDSPLPEEEDYFLSSKEKKKRDKAAKRGLVESTSEPSTPIEEPRIMKEDPVIAEPEEFLLSSKERRKRDKAAKKALLEGGSAPSTPTEENSRDSEPQEDFEMPLSKKEMKKRAKLEKQKLLDDLDTSSAFSEPSPITDPAAELETRPSKAHSDFDYPSTSKEKEKQGKEARRLSLGDVSAVAAAALLAGGTAAAIPHRSEDFPKEKDRELRNSPPPTEPASAWGTPAKKPLPASPTEERRPSLPANLYGSMDDWSDARKKKSKRSSSQFYSPSAASPLRSEITWDDYVGRDVVLPEATRDVDEDTEKERSLHSREQSSNQERSKSADVMRRTDISSPESERDARSVASAPIERDEDGKKHRTRRSRHEDDDYESSRRSHSVAASEPTDVYESSRRHKRRPKHDSADFDDAASVTSARSSRSHRDEDDIKKEKKGGIFGLFRRKSSDSGTKTKELEEDDDDRDGDKKHRRHHRRRSSERDPYDGRMSSTSRSRHRDESRHSSASRHRSSYRSDVAGDDIDDTQSQGSESRRRRKHRHRDGSEEEARSHTAGDDFDEAQSQGSESRRRHKHRHRDDSEEGARSRAAGDDIDDTISESRRRHKSRHRDREESVDSRRSDRKSRDREDQHSKERDQSFLGERVEAEELPPLPASSPTSPTSAPKSAEHVSFSSDNIPILEHPGATVPDFTLSPQNLTKAEEPTASGSYSSVQTSEPLYEALVPLPASQPSSPTELEPTAETIPLPISVPTSPTRNLQTPRRPLIPLKASSSTSVPLRFRRPPTSPLEQRERSSSFSLPNAPSSESPIIPRTRQNRPHSTEFKHSTEFRPLYLVERNSKTQDEHSEEPLPSLPSSRSSSYQGSDRYESAVEEIAPSEGESGNSNRYGPPTFPIEDVLGSQQTTPKASEFPPNVLDVRHGEPEYYSWSDVEREERMHEAEDRGHSNVSNHQPSGPDPASAVTAALAGLAIGTPTHKSTQVNEDPMASDIWGDESDRGELESCPAPDHETEDPFDQPTEPERPDLSRSGSSKKGKKGKKGKDLKLGTASTSEPVVEASAEELKNRRRHDTELLVDSWFAPEPVRDSVPSEKPSSLVDDKITSDTTQPPPETLQPTSASVDTLLASEMPEAQAGVEEPQPKDVVENEPEPPSSPALALLTRKKSKKDKKKQKKTASSSLDDVQPKSESQSDELITAKSAADALLDKSLSEEASAVNHPFENDFDSTPAIADETSKPLTTDKELELATVDLEQPISAVEVDPIPTKFPEMPSTPLSKAERKKNKKRGKKADIWTEEPLQSVEAKSGEVSNSELAQEQQQLEPESFTEVRKGRKGKERQSASDIWTEEAPKYPQEQSLTEESIALVEPASYSMTERAILPEDVPLPRDSDLGSTVLESKLHERSSDDQVTEPPFTEDIEPSSTALPESPMENISQPEAISVTTPVAPGKSEQIKAEEVPLPEEDPIPEEVPLPEDAPVSENLAPPEEVPSPERISLPEEPYEGSIEPETQSAAVKRQDPFEEEEEISVPVGTDDKPAEEESSFLSWLPGKKRRNGRKSRLAESSADVPEQQRELPQDASGQVPVAEAGQDIGSLENPARAPDTFQEANLPSGKELDAQEEAAHSIENSAETNTKTVDETAVPSLEEEWATPSKKSKKGKKAKKNLFLEEPESSRAATENIPPVNEEQPPSQDVQDDVALNLPTRESFEPVAEDEWALPAKKNKKGKKGRRAAMSEPSTPSQELLQENAQEIPLPSDPTPLPQESQERPVPEDVPAGADVVLAEDEWSSAPVKKTKKGKKDKKSVSAWGDSEPEASRERPEVVQDIAQTIPLPREEQSLPQDLQDEPAVETSFPKVTQATAEDEWTAAPSKKSKKGKKGKKNVTLQERTEDDSLPRAESGQETPREIPLPEDDQDLLETSLPELSQATAEEEWTISGRVEDKEVSNTAIIQKFSQEDASGSSGSGHTNEHLPQDIPLPSDELSASQGQEDESAMMTVSAEAQENVQQASEPITLNPQDIPLPAEESPISQSIEQTTSIEEQIHDAVRMDESALNVPANIPLPEDEPPTLSSQESKPLAIAVEPTAVEETTTDDWNVPTKKAKKLKKGKKSAGADNSWDTNIADDGTVTPKGSQGSVPEAVTPVGEPVPEDMVNKIAEPEAQAAEDEWAVPTSKKSKKDKKKKKKEQSGLETWPILTEPGDMKVPDAAQPDQTMYDEPVVAKEEALPSEMIESTSSANTPKNLAAFNEEEQQESRNRPNDGPDEATNMADVSTTTEFGEADITVPVFDQRESESAHPVPTIAQDEQLNAEEAFLTPMTGTDDSIAQETPADESFSTPFESGQNSDRNYFEPAVRDRSRSATPTNVSTKHNVSDDIAQSAADRQIEELDDWTDLTMNINERMDGEHRSREAPLAQNNSVPLEPVVHDSQVPMEERVEIEESSREVDIPEQDDWDDLTMNINERESTGLPDKSDTRAAETIEIFEPTLQGNDVAETTNNATVDTAHKEIGPEQNLDDDNVLAEQIPLPEPSATEKSFTSPETESMEANDPPRELPNSPPVVLVEEGAAQDNSKNDPEPIIESSQPATPEMLDEWSLPRKLSKKDKRKATKAKAWEEDSTVPEETVLNRATETSLPETPTELPEEEPFSAPAKLSKKDKRKNKKAGNAFVGVSSSPQTKEQPRAEANEEAALSQPLDEPTQTVIGASPPPPPLEEEAVTRGFESQTPEFESLIIPAKLSNKDKKKTKKARAWEEWPSEEGQAKKAEEIPAEELPVEETTVEPPPVEKLPVEEMPVNETSLGEPSVEEAPTVEERPIEDLSVGESTNRSQIETKSRSGAYPEYMADDSMGERQLTGATQKSSQERPAEEFVSDNQQSLGPTMAQDVPRTDQMLDVSDENATWAQDPEPEENAPKKLSKKGKKKSKKSKVLEESLSEEKQEVSEPLEEIRPDEETTVERVPEGDGTAEQLTKEPVQLREPDAQTQSEWEMPQKTSKKDKKKAKKAGASGALWQPEEPFKEVSISAEPPTESQEAAVTHDSAPRAEREIDQAIEDPIADTYQSLENPSKLIEEGDWEPKETTLTKDISLSADGLLPQASMIHQQQDQQSKVTEESAKDAELVIPREIAQTDISAAHEIKSTSEALDSLENTPEDYFSIVPNKKSEKNKKAKQKAPAWDEPKPPVIEPEVLVAPESQGIDPIEASVGEHPEANAVPEREKARENTDPADTSGHDIDFAATLAAGLQDTGFDPNLVIDDPVFHRRASPPGIAEADPEESSLTTVKNQKGKKGKESKSSGQQDIDPSGPEFRETTQPVDAVSGQEPTNDYFGTALAAGLAASGFASNVLNDRSLDQVTPTDEPEISFAVSKRKKGKKGKKPQQMTPSIDESSIGRKSTSSNDIDNNILDTVQADGAGLMTDEAQRKPPSQPDNIAADDGWVSSGDKGKEAPSSPKADASELQEEANLSNLIEPQNDNQSFPDIAAPETPSNKTDITLPVVPSDTFSRISSLFPDLPRVKRRTHSAASEEPRSAHVPEIAQSQSIAVPDQSASSDPVTLADQAQHHGDINSVETSRIESSDPPVRPASETEGASIETPRQTEETGGIASNYTEPTWSFSELNDTVLPMTEAPALTAKVDPDVFYRDGEKNDPIEHSEHDRQRPRSTSESYAPQPAYEGESPDEKAGHQDPLRVSIEINPGWDLPVSKQRRKSQTKHQDETPLRAEIERGEELSPLESTTKARTSYLFQTTPDASRNVDIADKDYPSSPSLHAAQRAPSPKTPNEIAGFLPSPVKEPETEKQEELTPYVPVESPVLKKNRPLSDVGTPEQGVKSVRRGGTPLQALREQVFSAMPEEDPFTLASPRGPSGESQSKSIWNSLQEKHSDRNLKTRRGVDDLRSLSGQSDISGSEIPSPSAHSNRSNTNTPGLRRIDRSVSGDLRAATRRGGTPGPKTITIEPPPTPPLQEDEDEDNGYNRSAGARAADMANVYEGWGDVRGSSTMSPTRPPSVRKRQSMHIIELEARLNQLAADNQLLQEAKTDAEHMHRDASSQIGSDNQVLQETLRARDSEISEKNSQIQQLRATLEPLQQEIARLNELNRGLFEQNKNLVDDTNHRYAALQAEHTYAHEQWEQSSRELEGLRKAHAQLSSGMEDIVRQEIARSLEDKNREINRLQSDLAAAAEHIKILQSQILSSKKDDWVSHRDEDYFDTACQKLCQHVQQWVLRFSKYSDNRKCLLTSDMADEKIEARLDNAILDGTDVDKLLADRIRRRDIFMSVVMSMIWEYIFTRYLFGMDREQRQKLKTLEKILSEVGPQRAVSQWRATTLTLLSRRPAFATQRNLDTEAVAQEIFSVLSTLLPPPTQLQDQILSSLRNVLRLAVDLSIEMRTQRAEYIMLPPLQPEWDTKGDLVRKVHFNAALMNERSGEYNSNDELHQSQAVVKIVLFPLVVKKGTDDGEGEDEIVVCPAQVLVAGSKTGKKVVRVLSGAMDIDGSTSTMGNRSKQSLISGMDGSAF